MSGPLRLESEHTNEILIENITSIFTFSQISHKSHLLASNSFINNIITLTNAIARRCAGHESFLLQLRTGFLFDKKGICDTKCHSHTNIPCNIELCPDTRCDTVANWLLDKLVLVALKIGFDFF